MQQPNPQPLESEAPQEEAALQDNKRDWFANPWILISFLVIAFCVFYWRNSLESIFVPQDSAKEFPIVYMNGANIREFSASGELHHQITSQEIVQYQVDLETPSADDYFLLIKPIFTFYEKHPTPWQVSSDNARGLIGGKVMTLTNNVVIQQDSAEHGLMTANTEELLIDTATQTAQTEQAVSMRNQRMTIDAIGMHADLQENSVLMKSNVKVFYAPN